MELSTCICRRFTIAQLAGALQAPLAEATPPELLITNLAFDTRDCPEGSVFVAISGGKSDGHAFLDQAFAGGARAAVVTRTEALAGRPGIVVPDPRAAISRLSALFCGEPSRELQVVGITGTNGKTTTNFVIYHLFERFGTPAIRMGTIGFQAPGLLDESALTTPDPLLIQKLLRCGRERGARAAVLEVSSHGLSQKRADDVLFDGAVFTNLTRDHLDYHGGMEEYFLAKQRLFELLAAQPKPAKAAAINVDDPYGGRLLSACRELGLKPLTYGFDSEALACITGFRQSYAGSSFELQLPQDSFSITTPFIGRHNAQNLAAAFSILFKLGYPPAQIAKHMSDLPPVPGRLEPVGRPGLGVFVDYAHTPDALENVLRTLRELVQKRLWVVFGCGGDRDRGKRPQMAKIAAQLADKVAVTSDNPRTEDPLRIIGDILSEGTRADIVEPDRRRAIEAVLSQAEAGDLVLIAGKGHENYQIIGTEKRHFSDQEEVRRILYS